MKTITLRVEDDLYEAIKQAAGKDTRSINNWIALVLKAFLEQLKQPSK